VSLEQVGFIAIPPGPKPGFDHADVWLGAGGPRMYVAHTGADRVDVIDCRTRTFLRSLVDLPGVAGVLVDQEHDLLFTSDRAIARLDSGRLYCAADAGELVVLDADDGAVIVRLPLLGVPDVVMLESVSRHLYVAIGDPGVVSSFDVDRLEPRETVETELGAHTTGWDPVGRSLYIFCPRSCGAAIFEESA